MESDRVLYQSLIISLLHFASEKGIEMMRSSNGLPEDLSSISISDIKLRPEEYLNLVRELVDETGNSRIGLRVGASAKCAYIGVLGYLMMNCQTYGEAIHKYVEYQKIGNSVLTIETETTDSEAKCLWLSVREELLPIRQFIIEGSIAATLTEFVEITGKQLPLKQVGFDWPKPENSEEYDMFFETEVLFDQPVCFFSMESYHLKTPIKHSNSELQVLFENHARLSYQRIKENKPVSDEVMRILSKAIVKNPGLDEVASKMGFSGKTLQLKLKKEGNTFIDIRNKVRSEFAKRMLENENYNAAEIGYLLGFSEPSAFYRTFKRWTGLTPNEFRKSLKTND